MHGNLPNTQSGQASHRTMETIGDSHDRTEYARPAGLAPKTTPKTAQVPWNSAARTRKQPQQDQTPAPLGTPDRFTHPQTPTTHPTKNGYHKVNTLKTHLYDQFRFPRGPLGVLAGRIMSKRSSNVERSAWTVRTLDLQPDAEVLELGYGPGLGLEATLTAAPRGRVVGLDHSRVMLTAAAKRNAGTLNVGRLTLHVGDAQNPPAEIGTFDAIFSCNVWMFWCDQQTAIECHLSLLNPDGQLAITHLPRHNHAGRADTDEAANQIETQMRAAGCTDIERHYLDLSPTPAVCVVALRSSPSVV
jgi:SAM-dependent methyltransferase